MTIAPTLFRTERWDGGRWTTSWTVDTEYYLMLDKEEVEASVRRKVEMAHDMMLSAAKAAGVPEKVMRCEHKTVLDRRTSKYGTDVVDWNVMCSAPAVVWTVLEEDSHRITIEHFPEPVREGWEVVGHPGLYPSEGHALAKAWSVTPPGGARPEVIKRSR